MAREIDRFEVMRLRERGAQVVEVLPSREYEKRHLPAAVSLPLDRLGAEARSHLDPDRPVVTYCYDSLCDMSGRAAARLESLGFGEVYNYQSSKVDWFANSLPAEGGEAGLTRLADLANRDVPRCRPGETVAAVRDRTGDSDICLVVDDHDMLLGLVRAEALGLDAGRKIDEVMQEGPQTHRPDVTAAEMGGARRDRPAHPPATHRHRGDRADPADASRGGGARRRHRGRDDAGPVLSRARHRGTAQRARGRSALAHRAGAARPARRGGAGDPAAARR
jgi:rhodanese-related sulfurtransferase